MTTMIVTYTLPYQHGATVDLCVAHAGTHPGLGEVAHGAHAGACEDCADEELTRKIHVERTSCHADEWHGGVPCTWRGKAEERERVLVVRLRDRGTARERGWNVHTLPPYNELSHIICTCPDCAIGIVRADPNWTRILRPPADDPPRGA